jgi:hypothetical protein
LGNLKGIDHFRDLGEYGRIILSWILEDRMRKSGVDLSGSDWVFLNTAVGSINAFVEHLRASFVEEKEPTLI